MAKRKSKKHVSSKKMTGTSTTNKKLPEWIRNFELNSLAELQEFFYIISLSKMGFMSLAENPKHVQGFAKVARDIEAQTTPLRSKANPDHKMPFLLGMAFIQDELNNGFPRLHSNAVISLWSFLENFVFSLLINFLRYEPAAMQTEAILNLKIELGKYQSLTEEERYLYIVELLEQQIKVKNAKGITRFENLLASFGLTGPVDKRTGKRIFELQQVRNVLVHQNGIADRQLIELCPWLKLKIGEKVLIDHERFITYFGAFTDYYIQITRRLRKYYGIELEDELENVQDRFLRDRRPNKGVIVP